MTDRIEVEKLEAIVKYQQARISLLEEIVNSIIYFNQMKIGEYNSCIPSDANFWNQQISSLINNGVAAMSKLEEEVEEKL